MLPRILTAAAFLVGMAGSATASTITVSDVEVDELLFADSAINLNFLGGVSPLPIIGSDLTTSATAGAAEIFAVSFTDNTFVNGDGFDLFLYEVGANEAPTISIGGIDIVAELIASDLSETLAPFRINTFAVELSDFGVAVGGAAGGFLLTNTDGNAPEILGAAAVNGGPLPAPVPLPLSGMLLLGGLGMLGFARRS